MKNVLYYHVYLTDDWGTWSSMVMEQMKMMQDHDLLNALDKIRVTCISQNDDRIHRFAELMFLFGPQDKFEFLFIPNPKANDQEMLNSLYSESMPSENITIRRIWNDSQKEDMRILYLHTKGITAVENLLKTGRTKTFRNYHYWRQYLNWGVIENWRKCFDALAIFDVAGVNYYEQPAKHYSGAFWWTTSNYIKTLADPSTLVWWNELKAKATDPWLQVAPDRFRDEMWICSNPDVKAYNVFPLEQEKNPAAAFLPRIDYENGSLFWHPV